MSFINYKFIHVQPIDEGPTMTSEQILQEKHEREDNFRRALVMANNIINNNPVILSYYWYLWTCRNREYSVPYVGEQMTRQMIQHMPFPAEEQRTLLQQHLKKFAAVVYNGQVKHNNKPVYAFTASKHEDPYIAFSLNIFDINDDNDRWLFVACIVLHELVHVFEPDHVDLQDSQLLYCSPVNTRRRVNASLERVFEQGEIFEIMMYGGVVGRIDQNTLQWECLESDKDFHFVIDRQQYRHFFISYDLTIILNIINRKKKLVAVRNYFRSIGQRINNFIGMFRTPRHT
jgi:hypothetical protein